MQSIPVDLSNVYFEAYDLVGNHIQKMIGERTSDFTWIRAEPTRPSFDDLNFRYKNQVFSVLIKIFDKVSGKEIITTGREAMFEKCTKENNLVPCIFPIDFELVPTTEPFWGYKLEPYKTPAHKLTPQNPDDWNLFRFKTHEKIDPIKLASDTPVLMSDYEMQNFAIQIVRNQLKKDGFKLESFCDAPGITPQVWFQDKNGKMCWVCVEYGPNEKEIKAPDISNMPNSILAEHDGYFAPVGIQPMKGDKNYRGIGYYVDYSGLINIHKAK